MALKQVLAFLTLLIRFAKTQYGPSCEYTPGKITVLCHVGITCWIREGTLEEPQLDVSISFCGGLDEVMNEEGICVKGICQRDYSGDATSDCEPISQYSQNPFGWVGYSLRSSSCNQYFWCVRSLNGMWERDLYTCPNGWSFSFEMQQCVFGRYCYENM